MRAISAQTAEEIGVKSLGLDTSRFDFSGVETLCALIRRCGAFTCPCPPASLVRSALTALNGIRDDQAVRDLIPELVEQLVSYGDFIESNEVDGHSNARILYVAPPSFVELSPERFLIVGIAKDDNHLLPPTLAKTLTFQGHARLLTTVDRINSRSQLISSGFTEIPSTEWLRAPQPHSSGEHVRQYLDVLSKSERPGTVDELSILNPERPVRYYVGRWEPAKRQTGTFVARRPQPYGAQLWSFVELREGRLVKLLDLPLNETKWSACDEAWHLQQAIDANHGHPQLYRVRESDSSEITTIDIFSPIPSWAQRRWDYVGRGVQKLHSLLAYQFDTRLLQSELKFARESMWLAEAAQGEA